MATSTFTIAASGGDYTSLSAYVSANAADLVAGTNNHIVIMDTSDLNDSSAFVGFTTNTTYNIELRVASGREHGGQAGNDVIRSTASSATLRPVATCDGLHVNGLGITATVQSVISRANSGTDYLIENCFITSGSTSVDAIDVLVAGSHTIKNTFVIGGEDCIVGDGDNTTVSYCTAVSAAGRGIVNAVIKNCIAMDNGGDDIGQAKVGSDKLLTSDSTGTTGLTNKLASNQFVSATSGSEDLNLKAGSDAEGAAAVLSIIVDYEGDTRDGTSPDCGADEFISVGGITPNIHYYQYLQAGGQRGL